MKAKPNKEQILQLKSLKSPLKSLEKKIGYSFKEKNLLLTAITHSSSLGVNKKQEKINSHYERLEFLGDAVLQLIISKQLYDTFPSENEGGLAKRRANIVCGKNLAEIAEGLGLQEFIMLSTHEIKNFYRSKQSILEDVMEALIGAVYLDSNFSKTQKFVLKLFASKITQDIDLLMDDPKSALQEWVQGLGLPVPNYEVLSQTGSQHQPEFVVKVSVVGKGSATASGKSKKEAQKNSAIEFLKKNVR
jgi:ribonuclease-3